jgi:ribonuclease P protein component
MWLLPRPHEAHLPAPQHASPAQARFPGSHEDAGWCQGALQPPPQGALASDCRYLQEVAASSSVVTSNGKKASFPKARRLRKRREFLSVQGSGSRITLPSCLVLLLARPDSEPARLGITVTRKFGNAVARNRAKRLFREIFRRSSDLLPPGIDLVVIPKNRGRDSDGASVSLSQLQDEWQKAGRLIAARADSLRRALAKPPTTAQTGSPRGADR